MRVAALIIALAFTAHAGAQDLSPRDAAIEYAVKSVPTCEAPKRGGAAAGVAVSSVGFFGGQLVLISGLVTDQGDGLSAKQKGLIATGTIVSAGALAGLIVSSIRLADKKAERERCRFGPRP